MSNISRRAFGGFALGAVASPAWAAAPPGWELGFRTPPPERDGELSLISGRLPRDLEGTLFRVGPAQFERAGERVSHWFDGDGMVQRFAIGGGRIRHRGRFVLTDKHKAEESAEQFLYFGYGFVPSNPASVKKPDDLNTANTNVLCFGGEVWALWEGGSPWRLDSQDLTTTGRLAFPGEFDGLPFSAHPKRGPDGDIWNFGAFGSRCFIYRLDAGGALRGVTPITLPAASLMHDFVVTDTKVVLLLPPLLSSGDRGPALIDRYAWRSEEPLRILVLDKADMSRRRIYELQARFLFHLGNAWEDRAGTIRLDAFLFDDATFASRVARDLTLGRYVEPPAARPSLITLRPDGRAGIEVLKGAGEFPRVDPQRVGLRHRFTYGIIPIGVARWDWQAGTQSTHFYGSDYWSEEPVFVPRPGRTAEQDGWVIATTLNMRAGRTELNIFDARGIDDGPIARFACPYALPIGFHGAFVQT